MNVNERMETSIKNIYAVGDIACINGKWFGQWSVAGKQGQVSGINAWEEMLFTNRRSSLYLLPWEQE